MNIMSNVAVDNAQAADHSHDDHGHDQGGMKVFGMWVYLMSDLVLFGSLFASYAVLSNAYAGVTFALGAGFIGMEVYEFNHLIHIGAGPTTSAYLSAFFALVGTHGLHVASGLIWMAVVMHQVKRRGLTPTNVTRISCLSLFWHFLDLVWICVFTFVYLIGVF